MSCDLQAITQAVSQRVDSAAGCVMRTVFNLISSHDNGPTPFNQPYSPEVRVHLINAVCCSMKACSCKVCSIGVGGDCILVHLSSILVVRCLYALIASFVNLFQCTVDN